MLHHPINAICNRKILLTEVNMLPARRTRRNIDILMQRTGRCARLLRDFYPYPRDCVIARESPINFFFGFADCCLTTVREVEAEGDTNLMRAGFAAGDVI